MSSITRGLYRHEASDPAAPAHVLLTRYAEALDQAWAPYTPGISAGSGALGSASATARYKRIGSLVTIRYEASITNAGTASGALRLTLPFPAVGQDYGVGRETQATGVALTLLAVESRVEVLRYDNTTPIASGRTIRGNVTYEAAS